MMEKAMRSDTNNDGVRLKLKEMMTITIAKHKVESRNEFISFLVYWSVIIVSSSSY
jgi:hypothetical protein